MAIERSEGEIMAKDNGNAKAAIDNTNKAKVAPPQRPARPATIPAGVTPPVTNPGDAGQNLQTLAKNPQAMATLQKLFAGGGGSAGPPAGLEGLHAAIGNSIAALSRANERTFKDLEDARKEIESLKKDAEAHRRREEALKFEQASEHKAKLKVLDALEKIVAMAEEKGGNEILGEAMMELAKSAGIPLTPEQIDTLSVVPTAVGAKR